MKKIIVTGATSFVGNHLVNKLIDEGYYVFAIIRPNTLKKIDIKENVKIIELEMHDYFKLDQCINTDCDCFISLAWDGTRGAARNNKQKQEANYKNSMESCYAALRLNCKKIISAGSQAEYGYHDSIITEETFCKPETEYGKSKLRLYKNMYNICMKNGVTFNEPRFFSLYGPGDFVDTMIISTINKMLKNETCEFTPCLHMWNFLYISDAIDGIIKLIETKCPDGAYNFGSNDSRILKDYVEEMRSITNSDSVIKYGAIPYNETNGYGINPDITKMYRHTNWKPRVSFSDGISDTIEYVHYLNSLI